MQHDSAMNEGRNPVLSVGRCLVGYADWHSQGTDSIEYAWFHWIRGREEPGNVVVLPTTSLQERRGVQYAEATSSVGCTASR